MKREFTTEPGIGINIDPLHERKPSRNSNGIPVTAGWSAEELDGKPVQFMLRDASTFPAAHSGHGQFNIIPLPDGKLIVDIYAGSVTFHLGQAAVDAIQLDPNSPKAQFKCNFFAV